MDTICGRCGKVICECGTIEKVHPASWVTGERLDRLAAKAGIARASTGKWIESDDTLRGRLQLSIIHARPWNSGIPGGTYLTSLARSHNVTREPRESDAELLARLLITVAGRRNAGNDRPLELSA